VTFANLDLALRRVWNEPLRTLEPPVLGELPAVGER
jgi:hypothetical protein